VWQARCAKSDLLILILRIENQLFGDKNSIEDPSACCLHYHQPVRDPGCHEIIARLGDENSIDRNYFDTVCWRRAISVCFSR
jgi:hypothetical protein